MATDFATGYGSGQEQYGGIALFSVENAGAIDSTNSEDAIAGRETITWELSWDDNGFTGAGWFDDGTVSITSRDQAEVLHTSFGQSLGSYIAFYLQETNPACAEYTIVVNRK